VEHPQHERAAGMRDSDRVRGAVPGLRLRAWGIDAPHHGIVAVTTLRSAAAAQ